MATLTFDKISRVITVDAPDTEITVQSLLDQIRDWEDELENMDLYKVCDASGKEALGGGVKVGITVTLIDWHITFEARTGPGYTLCSISGGNLVTLISSTGIYENPITPSAFVTITLTSSSSATLQELSSIQHSSFSGGVTVDVTSSYTGTSFPIGTGLQPVNNIPDAMAIAQDRGFGQLFIVGSITLTTGDNLSGMLVTGQDQILTEITIEAGAGVSNCKFQNSYISGVLDGGNIIMMCRVGDISYVNGYIWQCLMDHGTITLGGTQDATFMNCWSTAGDISAGKFTIDMGGTGQSLAVRGYAGGIKLTNCTDATNKASLDFSSGAVEIDSTISAGTIKVRGSVQITDNSTGTAIIDTTAVIYPENAYGGVCYVDVAHGSTGKTIYPYGTASYPVGNVTDAQAVAGAYNLHTIDFKGTIVLTASPGDKTIRGSGSAMGNVVVLNGMTLAETKIQNCTVTGSCIGSDMELREVIIYNVSGVDGLLYGCGLSGTLTIDKAGDSIITKSLVAIDRPSYVSMTGANTSFKGDIDVGHVEFQNMTAGCSAAITLNHGDIEFASTCIGGDAILHGDVTVIDNSTGVTIDSEHTVTSIDSAIAVWDKLTSDHGTAGTMGKIQKQILNGTLAGL